MGNVVELNSGNWDQEVLRSDILVAVDFWHENCPWCVKFNPLLEEASDEYRGKIKFAKLDVFKNDNNGS